MRPVLARVRSWTTFDFLIIFTFVVLLVAPWFRAKYLDLWSSIESTFIADARFLAENWPHPEWQPNWYAGTRTDYIYPPALRYGTASLVHYIPRLLPVKAYHIYVAFFYCFGIAAVYLLAARSTGSRLAGYLAAAATALISPTFLLVDYIRQDSPWLMPYRLHVLLRYGEGPHMTAVAWLPLALLFSIRGVERWRPVSIALAGICCAMIVANNFYGATSLAILFPILVWAAYAGTRDRHIFGRAALIIVISYGLTAAWLSPGYLQVTLRNMQYVSKPGNAWSVYLAIAFVIVFAVLAWRFTARRTEQIYLTFLCGATAAFLLNTVGNHYFNFRIIGEPARLFPELDLLIILLAVELLRRIWSHSWTHLTLVRGGISFLVFLALAPSGTYLRNSRRLFVPEQNLEQRPEWEIAHWMSEHMPDSRSIPAGTIRFWYDVWDDLGQLTGGSDQGILNPHVVPPKWDIYMGPDPTLSILWMQVLGVDAVIVNDKTSTQIYKDFLFPDKFVGELPILYDNGKGDKIFGVPRRFPGIARVVNRAEHDALPEIPNNGELNSLRQWHHNVEAGPNSPAVLKWSGPDRFVVHASLQQGQSIWVAESFDPNWCARTEDGRTVPISADKLGFMIAAAPEGDQQIHFEFPMPMSRRIGWIVTLLTLVVVASLLYAGLVVRNTGTNVGIPSA